MFKINKKPDKKKPTILYNVIEDYSEFEAPGNVTACAMTLQEDLAAHAKVLSESYGVPLEKMAKLLTEGGVYVYPQVGGILTRGLFACRIDPTGAVPKQTWTLDLMQFAEAEQLSQARGIPLDEVAAMVFHREARSEKSRYRLSHTGPCRGEGWRYQVHRLPQGLVPALQATLHHAGWSIG
jgi:hypothetical protein